MNVIRIFPFAVGIFAATQLAAQSPSPTTLVKAGLLLHLYTGNVLSPAAVLIENGKIEEVGSPPNVQAHAGGVFAWVPVRTAEFLLLDGLGESAHV